MSQNLVQISDLKNRDWGGARALELVNRAPQRPALLLELISELSRMFERIGMSEICGRCFRNENPPAEGPNGGCCGRCGVLGHDKCLAKPLSCATWMCFKMHKRFGATDEFLNRLKRRLGAVGLLKSLRETGVQLELEGQLTWRQKLVLYWSLRAVRAWKEPA